MGIRTLLIARLHRISKRSVYFWHKLQPPWLSHTAQKHNGICLWWIIYEKIKEYLMLFIDITFQNKIRVLLGGGWSLLMAELRKSHFLLMEVSAFSNLCAITCCDTFALFFFSTCPSCPFFCLPFPISFLNHWNIVKWRWLSCVWLCNPMDCSPPAFSVHGCLQARILEWVAIPISRGYSQPRDQTQVSHIAGIQ